MHILLVEDLKLNQEIESLGWLPGTIKLHIKEFIKLYTIHVFNIKQEKVLKYTDSHAEIQNCVNDYINN